MSENPFAAPQYTDDTAIQTPQGDYGGITRGPYFLLSLGLGIVQEVLEHLITDFAIGLLIIGVAVLVGQIVITVKRLHNLGYSGWWVLGLIVPILNLLVALRCLAAPEGYADHKTLDSAGKTIVALFFGFIVLLVVAVIFMG